MEHQDNLSINNLRNIHLCDCSHIAGGIDSLLKKIETANDVDDFDDYLIIPFHNEREETIPLYHYTNANALMSIISSCQKAAKGSKAFTLRFSRVDYMNDVYDGGEIFNFIFQECIQNELGSIKDSLIQYAKEMVDQRHSGKYSNTKRVSYVCSLTVDGDSLPIWRNYTDNGGGYNIKLDSKILAEHKSDGYIPDIMLIPVVYDCDIMLKMLRAFLTKLSVFWVEDKESRFEGLLHNFIFFSKLSFKHPSFSHEKEIRLLKSGKRIYDINPLESFSETNGILRPYVDVEIPSNALIGATVGPLLEAETARRSVEDIIGRYFGVNGKCPVGISGAPIRF